MKLANRLLTVALCKRSKGQDDGRALADRCRFHGIAGPRAAAAPRIRSICLQIVADSAPAGAGVAK